MKDIMNLRRRDWQANKPLLSSAKREGRNGQIGKRQAGRQA
jgi:hypothetical protein